MNSSDTRGKATLFWGLVLAWVAVDVVTKQLAAAHLLPRGVPHEIVGEYLRFTLVYNQGAAFGMHVGEWSRWIFTGLTIGALAMLAHLYRDTHHTDQTRTLALALVSAGAVGNLVDRLRGSQGVVDFIDVGLGDWRFWTFNVADIGVSCGAVLLALVLWREERALRGTHGAEAHGGDGLASSPAPSGAEHADR